MVHGMGREGQVLQQDDVDVGHAWWSTTATTAEY